MAAIGLRGVRKAFGANEVIKGVDVEIGDREFAVFVGPSGCGKSTLLRLIAGLEDATAGDILFDGERVNHLAPAARRIAMVFQSYALYPHMNAYDNMAFGLKLAKLGRRGIDEKVRRAARILRIEHLLERKPKELSGGQRQRVAIGRAIVREPRAFLFDEPLSNLDAALRADMRIEIARLHGDLDATTVYVTHDQVEAMTLADRIVVLEAGSVAQIGAPLELYHGPRNLFVAGFIGSPKMNLVETEVRGFADQGVTVGLPGGSPINVPVGPGAARPGDRVTLGVRPEHVAVKGAGGAVPGEVFAVERLGGTSLVHLRLAGGRALVAEAKGEVAVRIGEGVSADFAGAACHLFDGDGMAFARLDLSDPLKARAD